MVSFTASSAEAVDMLDLIRDSTLCRRRKMQLQASLSLPSLMPQLARMQSWMLPPAMSLRKWILTGKPLP